MDKFFLILLVVLGLTQRTFGVEEAKKDHSLPNITQAQLQKATFAGGCFWCMQFADTGTQYRTAIFYHNDEQRRLAESSKEILQKSNRFGKPIVTQIAPASTFYPAEGYHQKYYLKSPFQYKYYRLGSGRDQYLKKFTQKDAER